MSFDASKTIMLEKQYLYVKASMGFVLEGTNTERIWTNTGYYRFLVDNVAKALSNSYITIHYDSNDTEFIAYCSDLFMEEIQNTITTAVENLESYVQQFAEQNHEDFGDVQETLEDLSEGLSGALQVLANNTLLSEFLPVTTSIVTLSSNNFVGVSFDEVGDVECISFNSYPPYKVSSGTISYNRCGIELTTFGSYLLVYPDGKSECVVSSSGNTKAVLPCWGGIVKVVRLS